MQQRIKYFSKIALSLALILVAGASFLLAQAPVETIYLKDGSVIRGTITEYIKGEHIRIKKMDGTFEEYSADQVKSIKQGGKLKLKGGKGIGTIAPLNKGYYGLADFGLLFRNHSRYGGVAVSPTLEVVNGYQFMDRFQAGLGVGIDLLDDKLYYPVFLDLRYNFRTKALSPFINLKAGYTVNLGNAEDSYYYQNRKDFGGPMAGVQAGLKVYTGRKFGITCGAEYRFAMLNSKFDNSFWNGDELIYFPVEETKFTYRVGMRVGIFFH